MSRLPDLVRDSQLDTQVRPEYTRHLYVETDPTSGQRAIEKKEYWKREKRIGSGGIGTVWLEKCLRGKRNAELRAVKQFPRPANTRDLVRELEALAKFSHPKYVRCFVQSFGWYEDEDDLYIAMEYLPLGDLNNYLKAAGPVPELEVQQVVFQLLEGLSVMHANGFAHRDMKPANILICSLPPQNWWVKLADFGISKRVEDCTTGPSTRKGTHGFVPPEFHGFSPNGEDASNDPPFAADIWALGEITFRMLTKTVTFPSPYDLFQFTEGRQPFPRTPLEDNRVSQVAIEFLRACMHPSPKDRLSASQAIGHEWVSDFASSGARETSSIVSFGDDLEEGIEELSLTDTPEPSTQQTSIETANTRDSLKKSPAPSALRSSRKHDPVLLPSKERDPPSLRNTTQAKQSSVARPRTKPYNSSAKKKTRTRDLLANLLFGPPASPKPGAHPGKSQRTTPRSNTKNKRRSSVELQTSGKHMDDKPPRQNFIPADPLIESERQRRRLERRRMKLEAELEAEEINAHGREKEVNEQYVAEISTDCGKFIDAEDSTSSSADEKTRYEAKYLRRAGEELAKKGAADTRGRADNPRHQSVLELHSGSEVNGQRHGSLGLLQPSSSPIPSNSGLREGPLAIGSGNDIHFKEDNVGIPPSAFKWTDIKFPILQNALRIQVCPYITEINISPTGKHCAARCSERVTVLVWDSRTGKLITALKHPAKVYSLSFSPGGHLLASRDLDGVIRTWNLAGSLMNILYPENTDGIPQFSTDGSLIALHAACGGTGEIFSTDWLPKKTVQYPVSDCCASKRSTLKQKVLCSCDQTFMLDNQNIWRATKSEYTKPEDTLSRASLFRPRLPRKGPECYEVSCWDIKSRALIVFFTLFGTGPWNLERLAYGFLGFRASSAGSFALYYYWDLDTGQGCVRTCDLEVSPDRAQTSTTFIAPLGSDKNAVLTAVSPDHGIVALGFHIDGEQEYHLQVLHLWTDKRSVFRVPGNCEKIEFTPTGKLIAMSHTDGLELRDLDYCSIESSEGGMHLDHQT